MNTKRVSAQTFARFAQGDLNRWRALAGWGVLARDPRWGGGRVVDIRWEGRSDRPDDEGRIYVRVQYEGDLRVRVNSRAFGRTHDAVELDAELADFVARWSPDAGEPPEELETAAWDLRLREQQDGERARRLEEVRRRTPSQSEDAEPSGTTPARRRARARRVRQP